MLYLKHLICSFGFSIGDAGATNVHESDLTMLYFCEFVLVIEYI
jgi:hypothetical protein